MTLIHLGMTHSPLLSSTGEDERIHEINEAKGVDCGPEMVRKAMVSPPDHGVRIGSTTR